MPGDDAESNSKYFVNLLQDFKPGDALMLMPAARQLLSQRSPAQMPDTRCLPPGVARGALIPTLFKIVQTPGLILGAYENPNPLRQIYTDGRKLPPDPSWMGFSVGAWDGDTLVVKSSGFQDKGWLDAMGHPHSQKLAVTERDRRRDFGRLDVEMTIDDAVMYMRAFTVKFTLGLLPDTDVSEFVCVENEKDLRRLK